MKRLGYIPNSLTLVFSRSTSLRLVPVHATAAGIGPTLSDPKPRGLPVPIRWFSRRFPCMPSGCNICLHKNLCGAVLCSTDILEPCMLACFGFGPAVPPSLKRTLVIESPTEFTSTARFPRPGTGTDQSWPCDPGP